MTNMELKIIIALISVFATMSCMSICLCKTGSELFGSIARNPEAAPSVTTPALITLGMIELGLLICGAAAFIIINKGIV